MFSHQPKTKANQQYVGTITKAAIIVSFLLTGTLLVGGIYYALTTESWIATITSAAIAFIGGWTFLYVLLPGITAATEMTTTIKDRINHFIETIKQIARRLYS